MDDPNALRRALLTELAAFVNAAGARQVVPAVFRMGSPGGDREHDQIAVADDPGFDGGLRADLVERCLDGFDPPVLPWLNRGGDLVPYDIDRTWSAAAREGFARHGLAYPGLYVITLRGWMHLETAEVTTARVRRRRTRHQV